MKKVKEEYWPISEHLKNILTKIDFSDTFSTTNHFNDIEEITNLVFNTAPKWIEVLFHVRNKMIGIFGLKTKVPSDYNEAFRVGGYVKFFKIFSVTPNEVVLGLNDSHLNFRAVIIKDVSEWNNIKVITLVHYNNVKGKIYMTLVKPFHRLVVKEMVKHAYSEKLHN